MLTTTQEMLQKAHAGKYAVAAINTQGGTYDIIRAITLAAEELQAPVILAHYVATGEWAGHDWFFHTAKWMADRVSVPVAIHLDHGPDYDTCMKMLQNGFTSIMYDGSTLPLEENARNTAEIAKVCHAFNIGLEAEIGELARLDANGNMEGASNVVSPDTVRSFLGMCNPDSLAIGIGNAHGFYSQPADIRVDILEKCREFTDIPFVLHGCTGMDDDTVREAVRAGVAKINFGTQIRCNYTEYLKQGLAEDVAANGHSWRLNKYAEEKLREDCKEIIRLAGSEGKA